MRSVFPFRFVLLIWAKATAKTTKASKRDWFEREAQVKGIRRWLISTNQRVDVSFCSRRLVVLCTCAFAVGLTWLGDTTDCSNSIELAGTSVGRVISDEPLGEVLFFAAELFPQILPLSHHVSYIFTTITCTFVCIL